MAPPKTVYPKSVPEKSLPDPESIASFKIPTKVAAPVPIAQDFTLLFVFL